jgi:hypothetical protein
MTRGQLLSKRDEFWETAPAYQGRPEIWQALRAAVECDDTDTAQAIMSAVDVTCALCPLSPALSSPCAALCARPAAPSAEHWCTFQACCLQAMPAENA